MDCEDWPPEIVVFKVEIVRNECAFPLAPFCKPYSVLWRLNEILSSSFFILYLYFHVQRLGVDPDAGEKSQLEVEGLKDGLYEGDCVSGEGSHAV